MEGQPSAADPDRQALDDLRERILTVDAQMGQLISQRQSLVEQYERHRMALLGRLGPQWPPAGPDTVPPRRAPGVGTRALLLWLGAALLGISALTFSAVAWSRLGDLGHAVLLLVATTLTTVLAVAARRRLPMSAEAFVGLAVVLALVDVYAVRRAGLAPGLPQELWWAIGTAAVVGFAAVLGRVTGRRTARFAVAALLAAPFVLLINAVDWRGWPTSIAFAGLAGGIAYGLRRWGGWFYPEGRVVLGVQAVAAWGLAALLAGIAAPDTHAFTETFGPALAVATLALAPEIAWRRGGPGSLARLTAVVVSMVPALVALTLLAPLIDGDGMTATSVVLGGATVLASWLLPTLRRTPALIAGVAVATPGALWAFATALPAVVGPLGWLTDAWSGTVGLTAARVLEGPRTGTTFGGSWPAVVALAAVAVVGAVPALRRQPGKPVTGWLVPLVIGCVAFSFAIALAPLTAGASVLITLGATTAAFAAQLLAGAYAGRRGSVLAAAPLAGAALAAVPTLGWAAVSTGASVVTSALAVAAAASAALIARPAPALHGAGTSVAVPGYGAVAATLAVIFVGVSARAAGAPPPVGGFAVAIAAAVVTLLGVFALGDQPKIGVALECVGAATALASTFLTVGSTPWLAGSLTALAVAAAFAALRPDRRMLYGGAAGLLALFASWAWLSSAEVATVEAYTAPAALLMLAAGLVRWRGAPGRSWLTLGPAVVLGIGPTLGLGLINDDTVRVVIAALLCLAAVLAGAVLRLQAPLLLGAAGLVVLGIDQWGGYLVALPRWITLGVVGVVLMWVGATFEHRRRDWRRASDAIGHFR